MLDMSIMSFYFKKLENQQDRRGKEKEAKQDGGTKYIKDWTAVRIKAAVVEQLVCDNTEVVGEQ